MNAIRPQFPLSVIRNFLLMTIISTCVSAILLSTSCLAQLQVLEPTASFAARVIGSENVLVGGTSDREGTPWKSTVLEIKESLDRTVLEYDLTGLSIAESVFLDFKLANTLPPNFTTIFVHSFEGNGHANAADYYRQDNFVTSFTDNGAATNFSPPYFMPISLDVTSAYNQAIANEDDYLGFVFKNTTEEPLYTTYRIFGFPTLTIGVPEPSCIYLSWVGMASLLILSRKVRT